MNAFRLRRFHALVILQCVRWYCKYAISYRQLEERGVVVDHTTICGDPLRSTAGEGDPLPSSQCSGESFIFALNRTPFHTPETPYASIEDNGTGGHEAMLG